MSKKPIPARVRVILNPKEQRYEVEYWGQKPYGAAGELAWCFGGRFMTKFFALRRARIMLRDLQRAQEVPPVVWTSDPAASLEERVDLFLKKA